MGLVCSLADSVGIHFLYTVSFIPKLIIVVYYFFVLRVEFNRVHVTTFNGNRHEFQSSPVLAHFRHSDTCNPLQQEPLEVPWKAKKNVPLNLVEFLVQKNIKLSDRTGTTGASRGIKLLAPTLSS